MTENIVIEARKLDWLTESIDCSRFSRSSRSFTPHSMRWKVNWSTSSFKIMSVWANSTPFTFKIPEFYLLLLQAVGKVDSLGLVAGYYAQKQAFKATENCLHYLVGEVHCTFIFRRKTFMLHYINIILKNFKKQAMGQSFRTFYRSIYSVKFAFVKKISPPSLTQRSARYYMLVCTLHHYQPTTSDETTLNCEIIAVYSGRCP